MQTEDHPLAYADFEGIIPKGQYGGGTVLLWDRGTWEPQDADPHKAFAAGNLKFLLEGYEATRRIRAGPDQSRRGPRGGARRRAELAAHQGDGRRGARREAAGIVTDARPESVATQTDAGGDRRRPRARLALEPRRRSTSTRHRRAPSEAPFPAALRPPRPAARRSAARRRRLAARDGHPRRAAARPRRQRRRAALRSRRARRCRRRPRASARPSPTPSACCRPPTLLVDGVLTAVSPDGHARSEGAGAHAGRRRARRPDLLPLRSALTSTATTCATSRSPGARRCSTS